MMLIMLISLEGELIKKGGGVYQISLQNALINPSVSNMFCVHSGQ